MALPNFLIIGAAKAGTTSLYHYLRQHPDVFMSPVKEPSFYAPERDFAIQSRHEYVRLFDGATTEQAIGEASPQYLTAERAAERIADDLGDVRLIVSLRHPVDRAYSSYLGRLALGSEHMPVEEAMRPGTYYVETSRYHPLLARYFARFDRRRIKVLLFDEFVADPRAVLREVCEFLDVDREFPFEIATRHGAATAPRSIAANAAYWRVVTAIRDRLPVRMRNTGLAGRAKRLLLRTPDPLPAAIRARLVEDFRDDIARTEGLIGRSLSRWLS